MEFNQLATTRKGYIGEEEVDKYLLSRGIIPYAPMAEKAHPFDRLCATADKTKIFIAECKAKASRTFYPDTGINVTSYQEYKYITNTYGIDVWLFFVDENVRRIYGNLLTKLEEPRIITVRNKTIRYPLTQNSIYGKAIIYFPIAAMLNVCEITTEVADELKRLSTRNYGYGGEA